MTDLLKVAPLWSHGSRLLALHTPLGAGRLLAEAARIDESLGPVGGHAGYRIELDALSEDARLPLGALLGQPARLDLQGGLAGGLSRPFHGHVTAAALLGANGGFARYRLTVEPWLAFLGHNRDDYLFQDKSVIQIIDELFGGWAGQGRLAPAWRWALADASAYPLRGMTVQYRESDLAFARRLLAEEGLFCWFEHAAADDDSLGRHTLVIADHNGAFSANAQARLRYTQPGATLGEDSLDRWRSRRQLGATDIHAASWDYRSLSNRPQHERSAVDNGAAAPGIAQWRDAGQYAWQDSAQGERMLLARRQALDARLKQYEGEGTVRAAAPGTTFHLSGHPAHPFGQGEGDHFLITAVCHRARNNLSERLPGALEALGPAEEGAQAGEEAEAEGLCRPFDESPDYYRNRLAAQRAAIAWRALPPEGAGRALPPRPGARGALTGIVVGDGGPTHTDRDGRVRVQFPWQRGSRGASRQPHPTGSDNAPGEASLGVWLRVLAPVAGDDWGGHFIPRPGQEVTVAFLHGNPDRPVVTGAVYNGRGNADAPGNRLRGGALNASANAPAWFAGREGEHAHGAALSGIRSQQLSGSRDGQGGFNQLVFDDTPGEGRVELSSTQHASALQLGHLKEQDGNARRKDRGHGAELATQAALALRAGSGLLLCADARPEASGAHLDSREAIAQTEAAGQLAQNLSELAKKQGAALAGDPDALPGVEALRRAAETLGATATLGPAPPDGGGGSIKATLGGTGTVPAWSGPRLQSSAPAGIALLTPENHVLASGADTLLCAGRDANLISRGRLALAAQDGLVLFAHGKNTTEGGKPGQEAGIRLHAAHGDVSLQAQAGQLAAAAHARVTLASAEADLRADAARGILAAAGGAYLKIEGGNIQLHAPGSVEFRASFKEWAGPKNADTELPRFGNSKVRLCELTAERAENNGGGLVKLDA